jgi:hypothetical protein
MGDKASPAMKTTRDFTFSDRVFTVQDLMRFADILDWQVSDTPRDSSEYTVTFEDGHEIKGSSSEVFTEEQLNRPCRPVEIKIWLWVHSVQDYIRIKLHSGETSYKYENSITISGNDANWVNANYTALHDAVDKVTPQSLWWRENRFRRMLLLNLIALGVGTLEYAVIVGMVLVSVRVWPNLPSHTVESFPLSLQPMLLSYSRFFLSWPWRWFLGFPWAFIIRRWLLEMWPSIEFNFGSTYLRPDNRRKKLYWTLTAVIVPIIIAFFCSMMPYDVLKEFFK